MEAIENSEQAQIVRKFTLDGERFWRQDLEGLHPLPLEVEELKPYPPKLKEAHIIEIKQFHSLLLTRRKNTPNRTFPLTRYEVMRSGVDAKLVRDLCEFGYLREEVLGCINSDGVNTGSRNCYYYTPQGRALIRAKVDPSYGIEKGF